MKNEHNDIKKNLDSALGRRRFLQLGSLAALSTFLLPRWARARELECAATTTDFYGIGPFYCPNAPFKTKIASDSEPGTRLVISGKIYSGDCSTLLKDAVVDVWHSDNAGAYRLAGNCRSGSTEPNDYVLRGRMKTIEDGMYSYETVVPGRYLNGSQYRPSHIHYKISAPTHTELITQLYFEGDPYLTSDAGSNDPKAKNRIIPLTDTNPGKKGTFDIILEPTADVGEYSKPLSSSVLFYPHPNRGTIYLDVTIAHDGEHVEVILYDVLGVQLATLLRETYEAGKHQFTTTVARNVFRGGAGEYFLKTTIGKNVHIEPFIYLPY